MRWKNRVFIIFFPFFFFFYVIHFIPRYEHCSIKERLAVNLLYSSSKSLKEKGAMNAFQAESALCWTFCGRCESLRVAIQRSSLRWCNMNNQATKSYPMFFPFDAATMQFFGSSVRCWFVKCYWWWWHLELTPQRLVILSGQQPFCFTIGWLL